MDWDPPSHEIDFKITAVMAFNLFSGVVAFRGHIYKFFSATMRARNLRKMRVPWNHLTPGAGVLRKAPNSMRLSVKSGDLVRMQEW